MKKNILFFVIGSFMFSSIAVATIELGFPGGVSASTLLDYFQLSGANVATGLNRFTNTTQLEGDAVMTADVSIDNQATLTGGTFSGMRVQTTERASVCIGPSDGQTREFCMSGGSVLMLHGANSDIYNGASTGNITLMSDSGLNRHWFAPTGSMVVAGGVQPPIEAAFLVGSNQLRFATFSVDTTNDWVKFMPIAPPASTECDALSEKGRFFYDSTADDLKFCNGTAWTSLSGNGGNATVLEYFYEFPENADITYFSDSRLDLAWDTSGADLEVNVTSLPSGNFYSASCRSYNTQTEASYNSTGTQDIYGALTSGVHVDCVISANADTSWPSYYLTAFNTGTGDNATVNLRVVGN